MKKLLTAIILFVATLGCYAAESASESKTPQSPAEAIPFNQMKRWLHFTRADLDEIAVEDGHLDFSSRFAYEGDHSLRWKYQPGDAWVWKCNLNNLGPCPTFYLAALEPQIKGNQVPVYRLNRRGDLRAQAACRRSSPNSPR